MCIFWQPWMIVLYIVAFTNYVSATMVLVDDGFNLATFFFPHNQTFICKLRYHFPI